MQMFSLHSCGLLGSGVFSKNQLLSCISCFNKTMDDETCNGISKFKTLNGEFIQCDTVCSDTSRFTMQMRRYDSSSHKLFM